MTQATSADHDTSQPFRVDLVDYADAAEVLHAIRETVFVREQDVPAELERDALDPQCAHVLARALDGTPIGTGRLTPERRIGRMAVLPEWRGKGGRLFASGQSLDLPVRDAQRLAAADTVDGALYRALADAGRDAVFTLLEAGHYQLQADDDA